MITILMGKSASGKDMIMKEFSGLDGFKPLVTTTTRPMREGEVQGVDYNFVSKNEFCNNLDKFLEYATYEAPHNGQLWYYGSPKVNPKDGYITILDVEGTKEYIDFYGRENLFIVNVESPEEVRKERAMSRGSFNEEAWNIRKEKDDASFKDARDIANLTLVNDLNTDKEELFGDFEEAFISYENYPRKQGKKYDVEVGYYSAGYFEPPDVHVDIFCKEDLKKEEEYISKLLKDAKNMERE